MDDDESMLAGLARRPGLPIIRDGVAMLARVLPFTGMSVAALAAAASLATPASAARPTVVPTHQGLVHALTKVHPNSVCYSQTTTPTGVGVVSQKFGPPYALYNSRAADDFSLSGSCLATSIDVGGAYFNGAGAAPRVQVRFYHDAAGLPGSIYRTRNVLASAPGYVDSAGSLHIPWTTPVVLSPSTVYWVSVRVRMNFSAGGEWGWDTINPQIGNPAVWQNPTNGFSTGCTTWGSLASCFGTGSDLMFTIND